LYTHLDNFHSILIPPPPRATLFPYTTLFRSHMPTPMARKRAPSSRTSSTLACCRRATAASMLPPSVAGRFSSPSTPKSRMWRRRSEEHTSELQSRENLVCRLLLEKKKTEHNP